MSQVVIYKQDGGTTAVIYPTQSAIARLGITGVANKHVPAGKPYKIIDDAQLPATRELRDTWTVDEAELTDGVGNG